MARKTQTAESGRTVLVVDDQDEVLVSVRAVLERAGHQVRTAQSAAEALSAMATGTVDLLLVDQVMPEMSGEDLIRKIRAVDAFVPIVLQTGLMAQRAPAEMIGDLGIQGYHDKSDGPEKLLLWVEAALKSHRPADALRARAVHDQELITQVSHELRNPLQCIGGFADLLLDGSYGEMPEAARSPLLSLARTAHDLTRLVTNFLTHARIEAHAMGIERRRVAVDELAAEVQNVAETLLAGRPVRFAIERRLAPTAIHTDPPALRAILYNLLDNAARFTARGQITLFIAREGSAARIAVADTGPGIAPEQLSNVFEPFQRADDASTGIGLGLALARQLATLLGGQLTVQSQPERGSVFTLLLPGVVPNGDAEAYFRPLPGDAEDEAADPLRQAV
jgi:signal transduction histidine kinase